MDIEKLMMNERAPKILYTDEDDSITSSKYIHLNFKFILFSRHPEYFAQNYTFIMLLA